jgi:hypothetical protein
MMLPTNLPFQRQIIFRTVFRISALCTIDAYAFGSSEFIQGRLSAAEEDPKVHRDVIDMTGDTP